MIFNPHSRLVGEHAFLSASKSSWLRYDEDKLTRVYLAMLASKRGTDLHNFAADAIRLGITQKRSKKSLNSYINDALGYRMNPEQVLYFSDNIFGTCDAICFRDNILRVFDLKTGVSPAGFDQLKIYAGIFCHEYKVNPFDIELFDLRIYQSDEIKVLQPDAHDIIQIIDQMKTLDKRLTELNMEGLG